jgi:hypothetical protein
MIHDYLQRGVASGLVAGFAYGLYMVLVANPLSGYVEAAASGQDGGHAHAHAHDHAGYVVSETTTAAVSAASGVLWAVFLGGVFAVAFYFLEPALPGRGDVKAYALAGAGFLSVSVTPWLALPPAAPGAVHQYPIDTRLAAYLGLVVAGIVLSAVAIGAYRRLARRHVGLGILAAAAPVLATAAVLSVLAPTVATHPTLPADLVAAYRGLAVLSQAALWLLIAGTFTRLQRWNGTDRSARPAGETLPNS